MEKWIIDEGQNRLFVLFAGKRVELRYTVAQHEAYLALIESNQKAQKPEKPTLQDNLQSTRISSLDVACIALNPTRDITITREQIENTLDLDCIYLLAETWLQRKVYSPSVEQNPLLAPVVKQATHSGK